MMNHLERAREFVAAAEEVVLRQREIVAELDIKSADSADARRLLAAFERTLELMRAFLAHEEREAEASAPAGSSEISRGARLEGSGGGGRNQQRR